MTHNLRLLNLLSRNHIILNTSPQESFNKGIIAGCGITGLSAAITCLVASIGTQAINQTPSRSSNTPTNQPQITFVANPEANTVTLTNCILDTNPITNQSALVCQGIRTFTIDVRLEANQSGPHFTYTCSAYPNRHEGDILKVHCSSDQNP